MQVKPRRVSSKREGHTDLEDKLHIGFDANFAGSSFWLDFRTIRKTCFPSELFFDQLVSLASQLWTWLASAESFPFFAISCHVKRATTQESVLVAMTCAFFRVDASLELAGGFVALQVRQMARVPSRKNHCKL